MKFFSWQALALSVALATSFSSVASSSHCESIRDADQRNYCRALSGRPSACESIRDRDQRYYCRAQVRNSRSICESIGDRDLRQMCRAKVSR